MTTLLSLMKLLPLLKTGSFEEYTLERNKELLVELEAFQVLLFDRQQMYGNPNYSTPLIERELSQISLNLRTVIAKQYSINYSKTELKELWEDHRYLFNLNHWSPYGDDVRRGGIPSDTWSKAKDLIDGRIIEHCEQKLKAVIKGHTNDFYLSVLANVRGAYNESTETSQLIFKLIKRYAGEKVEIYRYGKEFCF